MELNGGLRARWIGSRMSSYAHHLSGHLGARRDICVAVSPVGRRPSLVLKPGITYVFPPTCLGCVASTRMSQPTVGDG